MNGFSSAVDIIFAKLREWDDGFFYILPNLIVALTVALVFVGLAFALSTIIRRCRAIWNDRDVAPEHRGLAIGTTAVIVALCIDSLFVNSLLTTFVMELLWILCALTLPIARRTRARKVVRSPVVTALLVAAQ